MQLKENFALWDSDFGLLVFPEKVWKLLSYQENLYYLKHLDLSGVAKGKIRHFLLIWENSDGHAFINRIFSFCNFCISH